MKYDLSKQDDKEKAINRFKYMLNKEMFVELKSVSTGLKSSQQNRYLHLCLSFFTMEFGYSLETVKRDIFKKLVNPNEFYKGSKIINGHTVVNLKSINDVENIHECIERFRTWSAKETGLYIPQPNEDNFQEWLKEVIKQEQHQKEYL